MASYNLIDNVLSTLRNSIPPLSSLHDSHVVNEDPQRNATGDKMGARSLDMGMGKLSGSQFRARELTALRVLRLHHNNLRTVQHTTLEVEILLSFEMTALL